MTDISLLLVDDQDLLRAGMAMVLGAADGLRVVGEATNGLDAVSRAAELTPDVVLMDVVMPELDGIAATRRILKQIPAQVIVLLTSADEDQSYGGDTYISSMITRGAVDMSPLIARTVPLSGASAELRAFDGPMPPGVAVTVAQQSAKQQDSAA